MNASLLHAFKLCTVHTEFLAFGKVKFSQESQVWKVFAQFTLIFKLITTPLQLTNVVKYEPKMDIYFSMTQFLLHTIAHIAGSSFMLKANNQPYKKILDLAFSWVNVVKNCKILTFKVNFLCQKLSESFQFFFHWRISI